MDAKSDPTLRPGDIVATDEGLMSYRGSSGRCADFTPVQDRKLANIPIRPTAVSAAAMAANARAEEPQRAQGQGTCPGNDSPRRIQVR